MKHLFTPLLFTSICLFSIAQDNCSDQPTETLMTSITTTQSLDTINAYIDKNWFVILDVRTPSEYNTMHIEEGVLMDYNSGNFSAEVAALDRNKMYVLHCASGGRSASAFAIMEDLGFTRVYNMTGGLNSWNGSGYPVTTDVAPIGSTCDNDVYFTDVIVGGADVIPVTITNAGNDTLRILEITDLSSTEFTTDLSTGDIFLTGSKDSFFYIFYNPTDDIEDIVTFSITTDGGVIDVELTGTATYPMSLIGEITKEISVYSDAISKQIKLLGNTQNIKSYSLYTTTGSVCKSGSLNGNKQISYSGFSSGIYILRLNSDIETKTFKLMLY